jgi:hypothetical protein
VKFSLNHGISGSEKRLRRSSIALVALLGLGWLFFFVTASTTGFAAEWSLSPSIGMKSYYNDNLLLTPLPHEATYGYWISPGARFAGRTERLEVAGRAALDFVDYYGGRPSRFTNVFLPLTVNYKTEKDLFGFTGGYTRDNTLMGELLATGLVLQFTQRNLWNVNPSWTSNITEKLAFQGAFQFSDASYQDGLRLGLVDYQVFGGSAGLLYQVTERDEIQLSGTYTNFRTTNAPFGLRSSYPGVMLTVAHTFTETLKATVYGGPRFLNTTNQIAGGDLKNQDTKWVYGADLTQQFENALLQFTLARDIMPSGFGLLIQTDRAGVLASYDFSEKLTVSLDTSGYLVSGSSPLASGGTLSDGRLIYTTPKLAWKFSDWWKLEASYSYRWRDADTLVEPVMSNMMMLMLTYYPLKLAISE